LLATLVKLKNDGLTILLVEQNVHLALAVSDYAYVVAEGRIFTEGEPRRLAAMPEIRQAYMGL
jgi:branched-chain amino acid transport system ATP-binding protein